ncbi:nuclear transcription factor, X-box binding stc isoform X1 [Osmia lignaria lignaria]|uniref:nuclear transcription factor, X-box binding stc isoform X1 n=2 Tax=Osmia lignaria lignaria TaxID=1437193 RepID=UPI00402B3553
MATWDGSDSKPDDQNYYTYFNENITGTAAGTWTFFPNNVNNEYIPANREYYVQNEPLFEHNDPNTSYRTNTDGWSMSSVASIYQKHVMSIVDNAEMSGNQKCFTSTIKPQQSFASNNHWKDDYNLETIETKHNLIERIKKTGNSNLHVTAEEFVPNNRELDDKRFRLQNTRSINTTDASIKDSSETLDKHTFYNTSRHERKYNTRRNSNYKPKEGQQDNQFHKRNTYKNSYQQGKVSNKFQGNKCFTNKYYSDKSQADVKGIDENVLDKDTMNNTDASSSKEFYATSLNKSELLSSMEINLNNNKRALNKRSGESSTVRDEGLQENDTKHCNNQVKEFAYYGSGSKQFHNNRRNTKKYPYNIKYNREENNFKEKRRNYQGYSRENFSKEHKSKVKEQMCRNGEHNELRECCRDEMGLETKEIKEKKYNYQGFNESKEYNKENKNEIFKEKDRNKGSVFIENNEKGNEHWNNKRESSERNSVQKWGKNKKSYVDDDANQRERLADQLSRGQLECLVCCEYIKQNDYIWSCSNCYHVLHLKCIKKWAKSSQVENGWRCPACQNMSETIPENCYCFCGKTKAPEWNRRDVAHSCGEVCGRLLSKNCTHKCTLLCHPGSCPPCTAMVTKYCGCGKTLQTVQCSGHKLLLCDSICDKVLNCGKHKCERQCHHGECENCNKTVTQICYCGKNTRDVTCQSNISLTYSCETTCGKLLDCGNHTCTKLCHADACECCSLTPEKITTCCCGQTPLTEIRQTCLDPVPVCDKVCSKKLKCGQPSNPHSCKAKCHQGDCPNCDLTTDVKCRCGNMDREIACKDLTSKADDARCEKKCTKKRSCGKHKCNQLCCIEIEHVCPLVCSKTLSCGRHKCEQSCHKGRCQPCWHSSFDELYCECGAAVIYPPVPCGTRRPACDRPCSRQHSCGHEVLHNCHSEPTCPPCTVLTQRWCHGKHELRKAVPCYVTEISCGLPCNKPISCGRHKCISTCHTGPCEKPGQQCIQPCTTPREMCGHVCAAPCHEGKCPDTPCKEMVKVTCQCGHRSMSRVCAENSKEYQRIASSILASKMTDMQLGHSINLDQVFGQGAKKQNQLKTLECNDECKTIERNRKLALGLQIVNPDLSGKLMPKYSDFMKQWAKKNPQFCQMVHDKLTELVQLAKTSKQKSRSYSFDCMNKDKRHFVHESCEHFGCESQAYDQEPKRNVVATAVKDKCWLPSYSLLEIVQRENGQRKVPGPMLNTLKTDGPVKTILSLPTQRSQKTEIQSTAKTAEPEIDYFDYHG